MRIKRKNMRDILVRAHDDHTASFPVHAPHIEDVRHRVGFGAKDLFVVLQSVATLSGEKKRRHILRIELAMAFLKHGANVNDRVDVCVGRRASLDGRPR